MRNTIIILSLALLSGCSTVKSWIPSFWDDNQSHYIVEARLSAERINCDQPQLPQVIVLQTDLRRFELYSESKGFLQKDVLRVVQPIKVTVDEWVQRGEGSKGYCAIKKKLLVDQTTRAASVVLGRF
jgi:uncharacterized protein YceK